MILIVFCCVNWDASIYDLPYQNATGMVEVVLVGELLKHLKKYAKGDRIGFIGGDRYSEHRNREYYERRFDIRFEKTYFVRRFSEWQAARTLGGQTQLNATNSQGLAARGQFAFRVTGSAAALHANRPIRSILATAHSAT